MDAGLVQRQAALAAVALLAALGTLALGRAGDGDGLPVPAPTAGSGGWEEAVAATFPEEAYGRETLCGVDLTRETVGVAHPVLPCGVVVLVSYAGRQIRTQVVERGPYEGGREFDLTEALARDLGFAGRETIRWRFAE